MMQEPIESPKVSEPKIWDGKVMYPRYLFDTASTTALPRKFYEWWHRYYTYTGSPVANVRVRLVANTHRTLETYFIRKKPPREILTRMETSMPTEN